MINKYRVRGDGDFFGRLLALKKLLTMQRHDSQERMEAGSPRAAAPPAPLDSSPSSFSLRSAKRRRVSLSGSPSTSQGSIVTAISSGATDTFDGRSNTAYKRWLQAIQPTMATHEYSSFFNIEVAAEEDGVWTTGKVQCLFQGIQSSMTRTVPADSILPNKSQPFSIVWADNTDSICDLQCLLPYVDNYANKRHKADATRSSTTNGSARRASNGAAAPSSFLSSSYIPQLPLPPHNAPAALPASDAGIFGGLPARPGDLVDNLTRSGSFSFLSELFDTARLFELRDFRITRVTPKGEAIEQFAACMHLVLDLADYWILLTNTHATL